MKTLKFIKVLPVFALIFLFIAPNILAQGKFEFGFHYSRWNINILQGIIEEGVSEGLESTFRDVFLDAIHEVYPGLIEDSYSQDVSFDSSGHNYGFELRWYPKGRYGSFSFGLSVEKTSMTVEIPELSAKMDLSMGASFSADTNARFHINPLSFHLSFRWDIVPTSKVHPYITFGVGASTGTALEKGEFHYEYQGELNIFGQKVSYSDRKTQTLEELRDDLEEGEDGFFLPGFIPFIQLSLGIKGEITEQVHLLVDAGIWDGFLIRGGLAFRF